MLEPDQIWAMILVRSLPQISLTSSMCKVSKTIHMSMTPNLHFFPIPLNSTSDSQSQLLLNICTIVLYTQNTTNWELRKEYDLGNRRRIRFESWHCLYWPLVSLEKSPSFLRCCFRGQIIWYCNVECCHMKAAYSNIGCLLINDWMDRRKWRPTKT